ncbi:MAG: SOS response-associated peptidase [Chloroflexota bacterium]|nr:SOS response-associated peptidase [Chloroflexota bacterium]
MCGRFALVVEPDLLQQTFQLASLPAVAPRYNIAPTQYLPVITNDAPHDLTVLRWGLIPSWSKDASSASKMINARSETAADKPAFRAAFKRRRCIIPASGFFEWQAREDGKTPMFIHLKSAPLFGLAGLWEIWHSAQGDEMRTLTILTTEANTFMQPIHDRMPVILDPADYALWLQSGDVPADPLRALMRPYDPSDMAAYEVSKLVNRPTMDGSDVIRPVA